MIYRLILFSDFTASLTTMAAMRNVVTQFTVTFQYAFNCFKIFCSVAIVWNSHYVKCLNKMV